MHDRYEDALMDHDHYEDALMDFELDICAEWKTAEMLHAYMTERAAAENVAHTTPVEVYFDAIHASPYGTIFGVTMGDDPNGGFCLYSDEQNPEFFKTWIARH